METLNQVWQTIAPWIGGTSIGAFIAAVVGFVLKASFNKALNKIDVASVAKTASDKAVERIKDVSFSHSIEPIVISELQKVEENAAKTFAHELSAVNAKYERVIDILTALAAYFDNSVGVSEEAKNALRDALNKAVVTPTTVESVVVEETPEPQVSVAAKHEQTVVR